MESRNISSLIIYPIKSCAGISLHEARLLSTGLEHDREFMLIDEHGTFISQRKYPRMALIRPKIQGQTMMVEAPDMPPLDIPLTNDDEYKEVTVRIWNDTVQAVLQPHSVNAWFRSFLDDQGLSLVRFAYLAHRYIDREFLGESGAESKFSDQYPLTLVSEASIADLNTRLKETIDHTRFRPNILVSGFAPYEEDLVKILEVGLSGVVLKLIKPVKRCKIVNVDSEKGEIQSDEVLRTVASYRSRTGTSPGILFCMKVLIGSGIGATLKVNDSLTVIE